jgi:hypothetical protein
MRKPFLIHDFATDLMHLNFLICGENFVFFFISAPIYVVKPGEAHKKEEKGWVFSIQSRQAYF